MITDVMFRSLRSRSHLIPIEDLLNGCAGSRMPEVVPDLLTAQRAINAAGVCPTGAMTAERSKSGDITLHLDYGKCIGCGRCVEVGEGAIRPAEEFTRCGVLREQLVRTWPAGAAQGDDHRVSSSSARERIYSMLGRALNIRQLDPGSCNGCEAEITALTNPYYDLERFGIHFVASPKHADMLLVTGPITRNMAGAVRKTYEAVAAPKLVVAVGACGCSGGIFRANPNCSLGEDIVGPVDSVLPVDAYIPGCPPTPAMLLAGILTALGRGNR